MYGSEQHNNLAYKSPPTPDLHLAPGSHGWVPRRRPSSLGVVKTLWRFHISLSWPYRSVACRSWTHLQKRDANRLHILLRQKRDGSWGGEGFGMFGFWDFSHGLRDKRTYTPNRDRRDQVPPGVRHQGLARQRQCETGPAKTLRMPLRCLEGCLFEKDFFLRTILYY